MTSCAGMNLIYEAAGMHGSLLGYSLERMLPPKPSN